MHTTSSHLLTAAFGPALKRSATALPPAFLIPSLMPSSKASFSTTSSPQARKDGNPARSISALHRRGPKGIDRLNELLSRIPGAQVPVEDEENRLSPAKKRAQLNAAIAASLPKPVLDPKQRSKVEVDPNHGLWEFFNEERTALTTPLELSNHGRAWTVTELRSKDWEDLWRLWWVCIKERNRVETFRIEKERVKGSMYGDYEAEKRLEEIEKTKSSIKHTLTERWYSWENARQAAMEDEEVNLYADVDKGEQAYLPREIEIDDLPPDSRYTPPPSSPSGRDEARV